WRLGYAIVGGVQLALGICFLLTLKQWQTRPRSPLRPDPLATPGAAPSPQPPPTLPWGPSASRLPTAPLRRESGSGGMLLLVLSVLLFFLYTGIETTAGQWAYSLFVEGRGVAPRTASLWVSIFWGALAAGRVLSG